MFLIEIIIAAAILALDMASKALSAHYLPLLEGNRFPIIDGVISFKYLQNTGAAFGIFSGKTVWLAVFSAITCLVIIGFLFFTKKNGHKLMRISLVMILAGGLGNMYDRIFYGYVRDFIYFELIDFAIFNIADAALCIGVAILVIYVLFIYKDPPRATSSNMDNDHSDPKINDTNG